MIRARGKSIAYTCGLLAFVALVLVFCLSGCAVGFTPDTSRPVVGFEMGGDADSFSHAATGLGAAIGGLAGGPGGAVIGTAIGGVVAAAGTALLGMKHKQATDKAFDEGAARAAGVNPTSSVPITPPKA